MRLLTKEEAGKILGYREEKGNVKYNLSGFLYYKRKDHNLPHVRLSKKEIKYKEEDILKWIKEREVK